MRQSAFNLTTWASALSEAELKQFAIAFSPHETFFRELRGPLAPKRGDRLWEETRLPVIIKRASEKPHLDIWLGAYHVLSHMLDLKGFSEYRQQQKFAALFRDYEDLDTSTE